MASIDKRLGQLRVSNSLPLLSSQTKAIYHLDEVTGVASTYSGLCIILSNGKKIVFADELIGRDETRHQEVDDFLDVPYIRGKSKVNAGKGKA